MKNFLQTVWVVIKTIFTHKRFKAFLWQMGTMGVAVLGAVLTDVLPQFGVKEGLVLIVGGIFAQITKELNSKAQ